jgi:hypothetical protein
MVLSSHGLVLEQHNVVLTGADHEMTGNSAPYHRVRLKTVLGLMRLPEHRPHERTLIASETLRFFVVAHSGLAFWITGRFGAICFIGS